MKKNWLTYLCSIATIIFLVFLANKTHIGCSQLKVFEGDTLHFILGSLSRLLVIIAIWLSGFFISKLAKLRGRNLILFFVFLTLFAAHRPIIAIYKNLTNKNTETIKALCNKSQDSGMICTFKKLTAEEYSFLIKDADSLPFAPISAKSINIRYYRDELLGDYDLNIDLEMPNNDSINTNLFPFWKKRSFENDSVNQFYFEQGWN
jgi:energy-coupling factor transporter transmembrane protein EcfT